MQKISSFSRVRRNIAKMGYYPTSPRDVELIATHLHAEGAFLLDPCCGEGEALGILKKKLGEWAVDCIGIEIEENRAKAAQSRNIGTILDEDFFNVRIPDGSFGCVFLNPPYDQTDQLHQPFIERSTDILTLDGILVLVLPEYEFSGRTADYLASCFTDVRIFKATDPTYKQVIFFGKKKQLEMASGSGIVSLAQAAEEIREYSRSSGYYASPRPRGSQRWQAPGTAEERYVIPDRNIDIDDLDIRVNVIDSATLGKMLDDFTDDWDRLVNLVPEETVVKTPLMPLRKGHLAQVLASGLMDGVINDPDTGESFLIKGTVKKVTEVTDKKEATESSPKKEVRITRDVVSVIMMDGKGTIYSVT